MLIRPNFSPLVPNRVENLMAFSPTHILSQRISPAASIINMSLLFLPYPRSRVTSDALHWLRVHYPIIFKICAIAYQALSSTQRAYLNSLLVPTRYSKQLRSVTSNHLYIPQVKTKAGTRAFSVAAPTLRNSLPASVKFGRNIVSFRRRLKTYFFKAAYPSLHF